MLVNSLGTLIYSMVFGKVVGKDYFGNKYLVDKKNSKKKWILYSKNINPTLIPVEWQLWLTNSSALPPNQENSSYNWQKKRKPNETGTFDAYHPKKNELKQKETNLNQTDKKIWKPKGN